MMIKQDPKISVLVPVYNAADFIGTTIKAVLEQTFTDFELILLNDASSDNSAEIIKQFKDPRIVYAENQQNMGIAASRNKLMSMARGKYIAVLDHDDICLPQRLQTQLNFLEAHPEISLIGSYFELFCPPTASWWRQRIINIGWIWCHPLRPTLFDARKGNVLMHPTMMYRAEDIRKHNITYNEEFTPAEDYDFVYRAMKSDLQIANLPQILLRYRLYGGNCSLKNKQKMNLADKKIKKIIWQDLKLSKYFFYPYWLVILQKLRLKFMLRRQNV